MTEKTEYKLLKIDPNEPMNETNWWKWLKSHPDESSIFHETFLNYIPNFDKGKHILDPEQVRIHHTVFNHFYWIKHQKEK